MNDRHVIEGLARPAGKFPHVVDVGDLVFVSGTSSRLPDNTFVGVELDSLGNKVLDVRAQTRAVLENIRTALSVVGLELPDLVQITSYLVSMDDFASYNEVYAEFFDYSGPARTTVEVRQLPHPDILIEMQAIARRGTAAHTKE